MKTILMALAMLVPAAAGAQMLPTPAERHAAHVVSNVTVATSLALDTWRSLRSEDRTHALVYQGMRVAFVVGLSEAVKSLELSERPDHSDLKSFWSEHTALAFSGLGGSRFYVSVPLAVSTGGLRIAAGRHRLLDVLVGAGVGALASRIR